MGLKKKKKKRLLILLMFVGGFIEKVTCRTGKRPLVNIKCMDLLLNNLTSLGHYVLLSLGDTYFLKVPS